MKVSLNGKALVKFHSDITFFIRTDANLYLLNSLKDAAVVEWTREATGCITIFKEHFSKFDNEFLKPLRESYQIKLLHARKP